jgi:hypothetical protein
MIFEQIKKVYKGREEMEKKGKKPRKSHLRDLDSIVGEVQRFYCNSFMEVLMHI